MKTLCWADFATNDDAFHVAGLSSEKPHAAEGHTHTGFAECFLVTEGRLKHLINGEEQVLCAGQFVPVRPEDRHDFRPFRGETFSFRNVAFRRETLAFLSERYFSGDLCFWGGTGPLPEVRTLNGDAFARMEQRMAWLAACPRRRIYIEQFLLDVLTGPTPQSPDAAPLPDWLARASSAMYVPAAAAEGTRALYRAAGRSPEHVSRELKRRTGETPTELVNRLRLEQAARSLRLGGEDITTIAYDCGFETLSYFCALFKKRFGLSPREYRKRHRIAVFGG